MGRLSHYRPSYFSSVGASTAEQRFTLGKSE